MYSGSRYNVDNCTQPIAVFCTGSNCGVEKTCTSKPSTNCDALTFIAAPAPGAFSAPTGSGDYYHPKARHYVSKHAKLPAALKNDEVDEALKKLDPEFEVLFDGFVETPAIKLRLIKISRKGFINSANIGVEVTGAGPAGLKTVTLAKGDFNVAGPAGIGLGSVRIVTFKGTEQPNLDTDDVFVALTK